MVGLINPCEFMDTKWYLAPILTFVTFYSVYYFLIFKKGIKLEVSTDVLVKILPKKFHVDLEWHY